MRQKKRKRTEKETQYQCRHDSLHCPRVKCNKFWQVLISLLRSAQQVTKPKSTLKSRISMCVRSRIEDTLFRLRTLLRRTTSTFLVSETWLDHIVSNLKIEIPGYDVYRIDRRNKRGGVVCAYVRQIFKSDWGTQRNFRNIGRWIPSALVKIQVRNLKSFLVCTTYRPPVMPTTSLDTDLGASLIFASLLNKPIYVLRDMNCNLLQPDQVESQAFANFCYTYNLNQIVTQPTRITDSTEALLDIILISDAIQVTQVKVLSSSISDRDLVCYAEAEKAANSNYVYDHQKFQKLLLGAI